MTGPHDDPPALVRVVRALDDGVVLHAMTLAVNRNTPIVQRNIDHTGIRRLGDTGLEGRGNPIAVLSQNAHLRRQGNLRVLPCHRLARMNDVSGCAGDVQSSLEHELPQTDIVALNLLELEEEVNAVLLRRLPLVQRHPRIATALCDGCHRRRAGCKDQTIRRILEPRVQNLTNCLLHRGTVSRQEELG